LPFSGRLSGHRSSVVCLCYLGYSYSSAVLLHYWLSGGTDGQINCWRIPQTNSTTEIDNHEKRNLPLNLKALAGNTPSTPSTTSTTSLTPVPVNPYLVCCWLHKAKINDLHCSPYSDPTHQYICSVDVIVADVTSNITRYRID